MPPVPAARDLGACCAMVTGHLQGIKQSAALEDCTCDSVGDVLCVPGTTSAFCTALSEKRKGL